MRGIFHTGITVKNLDRSIPFYRDVLGLEMTIPPTDVFEGEALERGLGVPEARLRLCCFKVGDGALELLEFVSPPSPVGRTMPSNQLGAMHLAFHVDDMKAAVAELQSKGVKFFTAPNVVTDGPLDGWTWVYFCDPDGVVLELIEQKPPKH